MRILVDADACPVKDQIVRLAKKRGIAVVMVIDNTHVLSDGYSTVITVDKARDSADIKLANLMERGDVVVTQDFGVAAMALGKGARALNQNGMVYDSGNMDRLLFERHLGQKVLPGGGQDGARSKSARPRTTKRFPTRWRPCWTNRVKRRPRDAGVFYFPGILPWAAFRRCAPSVRRCRVPRSFPWRRRPRRWRPARPFAGLRSRSV